MTRGEAFRDNVHEDSWDVGGAVKGEGWVKPTDLSLSVFLLLASICSSSALGW